MFAREGTITLLMAFTGGLLSFLTPCIFPLIPSFLSFLAGKIDPEEIKTKRFRLIFHSIFFVAGFSVIFIMYGATASVIGSFLAGSRPFLRYLSGIIVIIFALHLLETIKIPFLEHEKKFEAEKIKRKGFVSSFIIGIAFAAGWVPCIGPILSSILLYTAATATLKEGILYLTVYSLGLGVPFLLSALFFDLVIDKIHGLSRFLKYSSKIGGIFLLIIGILIFTNNLTILVSFLYDLF